MHMVLSSYLLTFFLSIDNIIIVKVHVLIRISISLGLVIKIGLLKVSSFIWIMVISLRIWHILCTNIRWVWSVFQSICIPECVESMVCWIFAWINASYHNDPWHWFVANEGISQSHCQLCLSKWNMTSRYLLVHSSDTFF